MNIDLDTVLRIASFLAAVGIVQNTIEFLVVQPAFDSGGLYDWMVFRTAHRKPRWAPLAKARELLCTTWFKPVLWIRLLLAFALVAPHVPQWGYGVICSVLLISGLLITHRTTFGNDGSDQMLTIVLAGLAVSYLLPPSEPLRPIGVWFVGLQSTLSYVVAGVAKLYGPTWRGGTAMKAILNTSTYGNYAAAAAYQRLSAIGFFTCWSVMIFETTFPVALVAPPPVLFAYLAMGFAFHFGTAVLMGLNTFLWAFLATYPAVIYCAYQITTHLHVAR